MRKGVAPSLPIDVDVSPPHRPVNALDSSVEAEHAALYSRKRPLLEHAPDPECYGAARSRDADELAPPAPLDVRVRIDTVRLRELFAHAQTAVSAEQPNGGSLRFRRESDGGRIPRSAAHRLLL